MKAYNPVIYGIYGLTMWLNTNEKPVQVPEFKKQIGRPNKARNLQSDEVRVGGKLKLRRNYIRIKYNKCNQEGHNKTTCEKRKGLGSETEATDVAEST
ncbi:hypothetical protein Ddye_010983 [Dipteronia dyeriana]|uniref:Uncharacterized protein n=1 Tax=Dipteronia dyeriana TaxID=168575 RepID=A0AAD9XE96_9ROSI|nr:hypothetical protein Ddye_010983 [Dipteronia dyeriana]